MATKKQSAKKQTAKRATATPAPSTSFIRSRVDAAAKPGDRATTLIRSRVDAGTAPASAKRVSATTKRTRPAKRTTTSTT